MGAGKSTVGKILAKKSGKQCFDLDHQIENEVGMSIESIFEDEGELKFRYYETLELKKISNAVVACGGGVILSNENLNLMKRNGQIKVIGTRLRDGNKYEKIIKIQTIKPNYVSDLVDK